MINFTLKTNVSEIKLGILNSTRSAINSAFHSAADDIYRDLIKLIDGLLEKSPEYQSLLSGTLRAEFGIADAEPALRDILTTLKSSVNVSVVPVSKTGDTLKGGINITMIRSGFEDILSLSSTSYEGKNFPVPWLNWLLLQGDRIIVAGYHINYNISPAQKKNSTTGVAVMEKGGSWRVPPRFSGTESDNWITRTFDPAKLQSIISDIVQKRIIARLK